MQMTRRKRSSSVRLADQDRRALPGSSPSWTSPLSSDLCSRSPDVRSATTQNSGTFPMLKIPAIATCGCDATSSGTVGFGSPVLRRVPTHEKPGPAVAGHPQASRDGFQVSGRIRTRQHRLGQTGGVAENGRVDETAAQYSERDLHSIPRAGPHCTDGKAPCIHRAAHRV